MTNPTFSLLTAALLAFTCTAAQGADPLPLITPGTPHGRLAQVLQGPVDRHELAGAVLVVADKRRVLDIDTVGLADIAANKPMQTDTIFWIASQSKPITATALMMLVDEGKVNVDDPVEKYLPEFRGQMVTDEHDTPKALRKKPEHPVLLANLLDHTSGLPMVSPVEKPTLDLLPLATAVHSYSVLNLRSEPGTKFTYANAGLNTIGRVIEVVSGMPYEQFLQKRIFDPLGMKDTTFWPTDDQVARLAKSYKRTPPAGATPAATAPPSATPVGAAPESTASASATPAGIAPLEEVHINQLKYPLTDHGTRHPIPAGGLFSTAEDLTRFCQMILNRGEFDGKRYLSEAAVQKMTSVQTGAQIKATYGFGWSINDGRINHAGAYASFMAINPGNGLISIYLVQLTGFTNDATRARNAFLKAADDQFAHAAIR